MFFPQQNKPEPSEPPAFELKFRLSQDTLVKLAPYIVALVIGGAGGSWLANQSAFGENSAATLPQRTPSHPALMAQPLTQP